MGLAVTLLMAMAASTFLAFALGALAPLITTQLALSPSRFGLLTTLLFSVAAACSPAAGRLSDRIGGRRMLLILFALSAVAQGVAALAPGYAGLAAAVSIAGFASAVANPATNKVVAARTHREREGVLMGVKQSGVQVGAFLAGALLPAAAAAIGWRGASAAAVVMPLLGLWAVHRFIPPDRPAPSAEVGRMSSRARRLVRRLAVYSLLMGIGVSAVGTYLPLYAHTRLGLSVAIAGLIGATVGLVGVLARVGWGQVCDRIAHLWGALSAIALCSVVAQALIVAAARSGPVLLWAGAVVMGLSAVAWNAVGMLMVVRQLRPDDAGVASGVVLLAFYAGYAAGPVAFGLSIDVTHAYTVGWIGALVCYLVTAIFAVRWYVSERSGGGYAP